MSFSGVSNTALLAPTTYFWIFSRMTLYVNREYVMVNKCNRNFIPAHPITEPLSEMNDT